jgi:hypothetical protein
LFYDAIVPALVIWASGSILACALRPFLGDISPVRWCMHHSDSIPHVSRATQMHWAWQQAYQREELFPFLWSFLGLLLFAWKTWCIRREVRSYESMMARKVREDWEKLPSWTPLRVEPLIIVHTEDLAKAGLAS